MVDFLRCKTRKKKKKKLSAICQRMRMNSAYKLHSTILCIPNPRRFIDKKRHCYTKPRKKIPLVEVKYLGVSQIESNEHHVSVSSKIKQLNTKSIGSCQRIILMDDMNAYSSYVLSFLQGSKITNTILVKHLIHHRFQWNPLLQWHAPQCYMLHASPRFQ